MSLLFELPHLFVVFPPGAGGNFISGVLTKVISREFVNIALSSTGNAHANSTDKLEFSDVMSCGLIYGIPKFKSFEEKAEYYKKEIEKKHGNDTDIKISWSHDFSNISLYKKLFPNCKILVVTQDTDKEKLAVLIQQELKNRLDPDGFVFLKNKDVDSGFAHWKEAFTYSLIFMLGKEYVNLAMKISNNYMDPKYKSLVTFVAISTMIRFYNQEHLTNPNKKMDFDYLNYCILPKFIECPELPFSINSYTAFTVGPSFKDCITDDCILLPYSTLMDKNLKEFTTALEKLLETKLDNEPFEFIKSNLDNYHKKQSPLLMDNPIKYYYNLAKDAQDQMKILKEQ